MTTSSTVQLRYAILERATQDHFLNVFDATRIEKMEWELVEYDRKQGKHKQRATAFIDVDPMHLMAHCVTHRFSAFQGWKKEIFGGSIYPNGIESRIFKLEYDAGDKGQFASYPYRIAIRVGPGSKNTLGGIAPKGNPTAQVSMRFPEQDMMEIMLCVKTHLLVHQRQIEDVRRAVQEERWRNQQQRKAS